jgi:hypothetical protein
VAISFPTSLDNFTNPSSGNTLDSPSHSLQHSDINDAVEAMQRKVGVGTAVAGSASAGQVLTISAAGTSTWSTPSSSGLTQIVPTSVALGSGSGSFDSNGYITFTGASSISVNGCFSSTYDNYRIIFNLTGISTGNTIGLKYRVGGTDTSTLYYAQATAIVNGSTVSGSSNTNTASIDILPSLDSGSAGISFAVMEMITPFLVTTNKYSFQTLEGRSAYTSRNGSGTIAEVPKSYDGFTLLASSGTFIGNIRIYGYKN